MEMTMVVQFQICTDDLNRAEKWASKNLGEDSLGDKPADKLATVLQDALYDSFTGPQLDGEFKVLDARPAVNPLASP